ncbi:dihydroorotase [Fluviicola chungangensis]|uniref:Dihydroorotase n=1 Tax=Fluviicola chungangensis TaxID=2597671 RepID=A0A556MPW8_9FLAO|nr:dihydroorotase [Fluviicola chungangensis]TSJ41956.1 dihydroorotase [Fluviicola chungangensis]
MTKILLKGATLVNEGREFIGDVLIDGKRISKIAPSISVDGSVKEINCEGLHLLPGCIDDQVHFREPGLTHKANIQSESRAAVAGGITSFMEMPNTVPNTLTQELLEAKYLRAAEVSPANYSFFMGASNDNYDEVMKTNIQDVCGVKIFMGSSTGNMLVDNTNTLEHLFANVPMLIATHCEDETTIRKNLEEYKEKYGEAIPMSAHPLIRSAEACYLSSSKAVELAKKNNTRLHILHISTGIETELFRNDIPLEQKRITAEACIHHLWFSDADYESKGTWIKWNPAVKTAADRDQIWKALLDNRIDVIATDHAPHTIEEKQQPYLQAPSGGPLVQHALLAMLDASANGKIPLVRVVEKMAHAVAVCFQVKDRGFLREGYFADLVLVDLNKKSTVTKDSLLYQCGWSPFEGTTFSSSVEKTFVNGVLVYENGKLTGEKGGERMLFNR